MFLKHLKTNEYRWIWKLRTPIASLDLLRFASKRLLISDVEIPEVSGAPRGDLESLKEVFKSSKVTIHGICRVITRRQGAAGSSKRAPKELLESQNEVQSSPEERNKTCREPWKRSSDQKRKNTNVLGINEKRWFLKLRRHIRSSDLHRKGSWHQILRFWRSLGHWQATRRASRRSPRAPKSRSTEPVEWFWAPQKVWRTSARLRSVCDPPSGRVIVAVDVVP